MAIFYRKLQANDTALYRQIRLESLRLYPESFGTRYEDAVQLEKLDFELIIPQQLHNRFIVGAWDNDQLIGICGFAQEQRPKTKHIGELIQVYVKPAYQGQKIGVHLLQHAIREAFSNPEVEQITLGVAVHNVAANKLYEQLGFQEIGVHKDYFKQGDAYFDERFMVLYKHKAVF